eukprot:4780235-Pleurochrysis_carterae.AAC.2
MGVHKLLISCVFFETLCPPQVSSLCKPAQTFAQSVRILPIPVINIYMPPMRPHLPLPSIGSRSLLAHVSPSGDKEIISFLSMIGRIRQHRACGSEWSALRSRSTW